MDCAGVASHLVGYHFGLAPHDDDTERDAIEAHLLECRACLGTYLALKRACDKTPLDRPSAAAKQRLRRDVLAAFPAPAGRPARITLLARRIPLYQGLCGAALAAAIALLIPRFVSDPRRGEIPEGAARIDSSRPRAEAFGIY